MKLNLGCWIHPIAGYHNVDIVRWPGTDEVVDLNLLPWPWSDGQFSEVRAADILEHLGKITKSEAVAELARITKPGGTVVVRVPCESHPWAWSNLQHAHAFQYNSFESSYAQPWFAVQAVYVQFTDVGTRFKLNLFTRRLCKYTRFIHHLEFVLVKNSLKERKG